MRVLGCPPGDRVAADRAAMLPLPPVPPEVGWRKSLRLPRDHYVRLDSNDYSVHPAVIGRRVEVHADLDRVWVTCEGAIVADHARVWAQHQTITDFEHTVAAKLLRHGRGDLLAAGRGRRHRRGGRDPLTRRLRPSASDSLDAARSMRRSADGHPHQHQDHTDDGP